MLHGQKVALYDTRENKQGRERKLGGKKKTPPSTLQRSQDTNLVKPNDRAWNSTEDVYPYSEQLWSKTTQATKVAEYNTIGWETILSAIYRSIDRNLGEVGWKENSFR